MPHHVSVTLSGAIQHIFAHPFTPDGMPRARSISQI